MTSTLPPPLRTAGAPANPAPEPAAAFVRRPGRRDRRPRRPHPRVGLDAADPVRPSRPPVAARSAADAAAGAACRCLPPLLAGKAARIARRSELRAATLRPLVPGTRGRPRPATTAIASTTPSRTTSTLPPPLRTVGAPANPAPEPAAAFVRPTRDRRPRRPHPRVGLDAADPVRPSRPVAAGLRAGAACLPPSIGARSFLIDHHFSAHIARDLQRPGKRSDPLLALWVRRNLAGDDDTRQPLICFLIQRSLSLVPLRRVMRRRQVAPTLSAQPARTSCLLGCEMDPIIPTEPFLQTQVYDLANGGDLIFERDLFALTDFLGRTPPVFYGGQISDNGQLQWLIMANLPGKPESPMFRQIQFSLRENTWVDGLAHALQESLARLCGQNSLAIEGERFAHFARHSSVGLPLSLPYHPVLRHHVDHLDYMLYETRSALSDSRSAANHTQQQLNQYAETIKVIAKERRTLRQLVAKRDATIHRLKTKIAVLKETISTQVEQLQILEGEGEGEDIQGDGYSYVSNDNDYEPEEEGDDDFHQTCLPGWTPPSRSASMDSFHPLLEHRVA
ncbi:hypothetical protein QYE76_066934 [Lolium multiflorum]|uniref:Uncharacterized protein n=1 Tax=Lolium multiflorum TaxID=4521 RepID=A0AAD8WCI2_LOLMU|nr:hypothetical protein QYE76_066934 [Lolium multiflorum]